MASIKRRAAAMKETEHKRHRLADLLLVLLAALLYLMFRGNRYENDKLSIKVTSVAAAK